ncbi:hypothetical protein [Prevotella pallens]|uniref:hypothetical protein n=1 Tax=Prevotella pallens TaxID=60133 RepID=UPI0028D0CB3D|nr:hypothetical protein [Prevotella pallens]
MPFCAITWVRYDVLQCQWWKIATPFCGISWVRYDVLQRHFVELRGCGMMYCNANDGNTQHHFGVFGGTVQCIAISTVGNCNAISGYYVGTGTINRPLRLRGGRGKIYKQTYQGGLFIIQNVYQRTFRNIHLLRKCMVANTP